MSFLRAHYYKLMITALALMVVVEYNFGVLYEVYSTFNLTLPTLANDAGTKGTSLMNYNAVDRTLKALQFANRSDPISLDLLDTNGTMCPLVSPLLGNSFLLINRCTCYSFTTTIFIIYQLKQIRFT